MVRLLTKTLLRCCRGKQKKVMMALVGAVFMAVIIAPAPAMAADAEELALLDQINNYRAQNGLGKLSFSETLAKAAKGHSADMAAKNYFSHDSLSGASFSDRIKAAGYKTNTSLGENIAAGMTDGAATFEGWRKSPGHNSIMLGKSFKAVGIGRAYNAKAKYKWYWTADFGGYADSTTQPAVPVADKPSTGTPSTQTGTTIGNTANWGTDSIKWLMQNKGLKGYPDGSLRPTKAVTRAEFATMVAQAFGVKPTGQTVFKDTKGHWGMKQIAALADRGVIKGFVDGNFRPNNLITRAEMTQVITKAAGLKSAASLKNEFCDINGHWAKNTILVAASNSVVNGYANGKFKPDAASTRAEAATTLCRLVK